VIQRRRATLWSSVELEGSRSAELRLNVLLRRVTLQGIMRKKEKKKEKKALPISD